MPNNEDQDDFAEVLKKREFIYDVENQQIIEKWDSGHQCRIDFDIDDNGIKGYKSPNTRGPPTNKNKNETAMGNKEQLAEDLTEKQYRENYWRENDKFKEDGSTLMMEIRISKLKELHPDWSYEKCSKEVKKEMKNKGSENTNTEDTIDEEKIIKDAKEEKEEKEEKPKKEEEEEEEDKEEDKKKDKKKDMSEIDVLKAKLAEAEKKVDKVDKIEKDFNDFVALVDKEKAVIAQKEYEEKFKVLTEDFTLPDDPVQELVEFVPKDKRMDFISKLRIVGNLIAKKEPESVATYDTKDYQTNYEKLRETIHDKLRTV